MQRRGFGSLIIILTVFVTIAVLGGIWYYKAKQTQIHQPISSEPPSIASTTSVPPDETAAWRTYQNSKYGIEFKYPPTLHVSEASPGFQIETIDLSPANASATIGLMILCADPGAISSSQWTSNTTTLQALFLQQQQGQRTDVGQLIETSLVGGWTLSVFNQGAYEYDDGADGFTGLLFAPGPNKNGYIAIRELVISTDRKPNGSIDLQNLRGLFLNQFLPSLKLTNSFGEPAECFGKGEQHG